MNPQLHDFATRYTAAWCSQKPQSVAAFFSPAGSLTINAGSPAVGRAAIAAAAAGFMRAFPDLVVQMETLEIGPPVVYRWLLTGTNTAPAARDARCGSGDTRSGFSVLTV